MALPLNHKADRFSMLLNNLTTERGLRDRHTGELLPLRSRLRAVLDHTDLVLRAYAATEGARDT